MLTQRLISISICSTRATRPPLPLAQTRESPLLPKLTTTTMTLHESFFWWIINLTVVVLILLNYLIMREIFQQADGRTLSVTASRCTCYQCSSNENDDPIGASIPRTIVIQNSNSFPPNQEMTRIFNDDYAIKIEDIWYMDPIHGTCRENTIWMASHWGKRSEKRSASDFSTFQLILLTLAIFVQFLPLEEMIMTTMFLLIF